MDRAAAVLETLESGEQSGAIARLAEDLPLFAALGDQPARAGPAPSAVEEALADVNPDDLSPREALDVLYRLRGLLAD